MNLHEWPLTLFTVFGQMAVGAFIVLGVIQVLGRTKHSTAVIDRVATPALYAIGPIMVAGFFAAFFHLGNPLNSLNALRGWQTSALTQEVIMGVVFAAFGFFFAASQYFQWFGPRVRAVLAVLTALIGVVFIWTMARLYMLPTIPAWNHWTTPAQFYITALSTGALAIGVAFASWPFLRNATWINKLMPANRRQDNVDDAEVFSLIASALRWIGIIVVVLLPLELVVLLFFYGRPEQLHTEEFPFPMGWFIVRVALLIIGAGLVGLSLMQMANRAEVGSVERERAQRNLLILVTVAYVLVTISGIIGRFIFYGSIDKIGL